ncbi:hypothetical protein PMZ80_002963 [Knufia obscura]|uniref:Uncharacterized protein n=1 Tax=Knufia obscura TaxID=1635080 RepID=A0ABR0RZS5_9EURO|nr:hypothetical protein PMZ80_002963 [Knufia obscura]
METSSFTSYITTPPPSTSHHQSHTHTPNHQSKSSVSSLYDLLADLDEHQLTYLIQEMNHTAPQNMAVGQAISAIETPNPSYSLTAARANMQRPTMERSMSKSQRIRLSLQTMFRAPSVRQQRQQSMQDGMDGTLEVETPTSRRKSPAYKRISRPTFNLPPGVTVSDLLNLLEAEFLYNNTPSSSQLSPSSSSFSPSSSFSYGGSTPSPTTSHGSGLGRIRRYPSTIDMALEAERSASGIEGIGLGMLEPRPTTPACGTPTRARSGSPSTPVFDRRVSEGRLRGETPPPTNVAGGVAPPVVLDGIFEVLETR